jgi:hypothetical protein
LRQIEQDAATLIIAAITAGSPKERVTSLEEAIEEGYVPPFFADVLGSSAGEATVVFSGGRRRALIIAAAPRTVMFQPFKTQIRSYAPVVQTLLVSPAQRKLNGKPQGIRLLAVRSTRAQRNLEKQIEWLRS